jgi:Mce-associated membrane protein
MTERPGQDTAPDDLSAPAPEPGRSTSPTASRPSPTSRARRTAAAAPDGLRRPRPSPRPAPAGAAPQASATATTDHAPTDHPADPATTGDDHPDPTPAASQEPQQAAEAADVDDLDHQPADLVSRQPSAAEAGRRVPAWLLAALAVVVLALAALDGWLLTSPPDVGSRAEREQALSTAKTAVPLILSYDYRRFDADVAAARARLTGRAVEDYVKAMTTTIKPTATKVHAVVQAQTDGAGVEAVSGDGNQVTVVVFGQQKVTNTSLTAARIDLFRVRVTLDRVRDQWLVSKFDQI